MIKKIITLLTLFLVLIAVQAHEFWMHPDKFFFSAGEKAVINFEVGENFAGEPWNLKKSRVEKLEHYYLDKKADLKSQVVEGEKENITLTLTQQGTQMIVMQSNNAFITLEAEKFNQYLKEDGLDEAYYHREQTKTLDDSAKELYSRHTKLLLQVGSKTDDTYKKIVGLPIEIVPETNPYTMKVGDLVKFKILFEGKPLFGARVKVWNKYNNRTTQQPVYSQQDGTIEARISNPGPWMVSVVNMVRSKDPKADWQSYWGSLVFGVK